MKYLILFLFLLTILPARSQAVAEWVDDLQIDLIEPNSSKRFWLKIVENGTAQPIGIPVIVLKGKQTSPILGLTAAIHGNELNGIKVIQEVIESIDVSQLNGTLIAVPGLNAISIPLHQRKYIDDEDLNRLFPGKEFGNRSQQFVWQVNSKLLSKLEYLIDMHTASFGRENAFYVRAFMGDQAMKIMAELQNADIILKNEGTPSTGEQTGSSRTMRMEAMMKGIPTITVEYGNPQVYQPKIIERGKVGILNVMRWLNMINSEIVNSENAVVCKSSRWIYMKEGGYLDVKVNLNQRLQKGDLIAIVRNPFGDIINSYYSPEDGIVIGKSTNPVNFSGGRIIHLGITDK